MYQLLGDSVVSYAHQNTHVTFSHAAMERDSLWGGRPQHPPMESCMNSPKLLLNGSPSLTARGVTYGNSH